MRAFLLFALALTLPLPLIAEEAYRADIGDSCRHAAQIETNLGKKPTYDAERMLQRNLLLFEGAGESGGNEQVLYRCSEKDGTVIGYSTRLYSVSEQLAWSALARAKGKIQAQHGAPAIESQGFGLPQRIRRWRAYSAVFSVDEFSQWENVPGQSVSVRIQKLRDSAQWQVVTTNMPALSEAVQEPRDQELRILARAAVVAISSAALTAALAMTRMHPHRWLIALVAPLALGYESLWASPWNAARSPESIGWNLFAVASCFVLGAMVSLFVIWRLSGQLAPREMPASAKSQVAKPLLVLGLVLFAALLAWVWWQFRPGNDPGNLAGGFSFELVLPPVVLFIATVLTVLGTMRLCSVPTAAAAGTPSPDHALAIIGVLASVVGVTLCVTIAAEIALSL